MVKITLEVADNGIIKTISDDNSNGAGSSLEKKKVYEFNDDEFHENKIRFFYELADELSINTGNEFEDNNLVMRLDWGNSYIPTKDEIQFKIKLLKVEQDLLKLKLTKYQEIDNELNQYEGNKLRIQSK